MSPRKVFICSSPQDEALRKELLSNLWPAVQSKLVDLTLADPLLAGAHWRSEADAAIRAADLGVLLLSRDFFADTCIIESELPALRHRRDTDGLPLVPIVARRVLWSSHPALKDLTPWPAGGKALMSHKSKAARDNALVEICQHILTLPLPARLAAPPAAAQSIPALPPPAPLAAPPAADRSVLASRQSSPFSYHPDWYVEREEEEMALRYLACPGMPIVLTGPARSGKSWLLFRILDRVRQQDPVNHQVAVLNLGFFASFSSLEDLLLEFAKLLLEQFFDAAGVADKLRRCWLHGNVKQRLTRVVEEVLAHLPGDLYLAIERADEVWQRPYLHDFFNLFRLWVDNPTGAFIKLRLILCLSTEPALLLPQDHASPFRLVPPLYLEDLSDAQVRILAERHGLSWTEQQFIDLRQHIGGQPDLLNRVFQAAACGGSINQVLRLRLRQLSDSLQMHPHLWNALKAIASKNGTLIDSIVSHRLEQLGMIKYSGHDVALRYQIYYELPGLT